MAILPASVKKIDSYAFYDCSGLKKVVILSETSEFGSLVFAGCTGLTSAGPIGSGCDVEFAWTSEIPAWAFYSSSITSAIIPDGITRIGEYAFWLCEELENASISDSVTEIERSAFDGCVKLSSVSIPSGILTIGQEAFRSCGCLTDVQIPINIKEINQGVFYDCIGLTNVVIPENITDIGWLAFKGCYNLKTVTIPASTMRIEESAFAGCEKLSDVYYDGTEEQWSQIYIKSNNDPLLNAAFHSTVIASGVLGDNLRWTLNSVGLLTISGEGNMDDFSFSQGDAWRAYKDQIYRVEVEEGILNISKCAFSNCSNLSTILLPTTLKTIGESAFIHCQNLNSVALPDGVISIHNYAFQDCKSLTSFLIPSSVSSIGQYALSCCGLTAITIPSNVKKIGEGLFWADWELKNVTLNQDATEIVDRTFEDCRKLESIVIPSGVVAIGRYAFDNCISLTSISVSSNIKNIGDSAFSRCSSLAEVNFYGTQAQWNTITTGNDNADLLSATIHFIQIPEPDFVLPDNLSIIGDEAFNGGAFTYAKLPENAVSIGWHAFADCPNLAYIYIPALTTQIDEEAFGNLEDLTIIGKVDSTAEFFRI